MQHRRRYLLGLALVGGMTRAFAGGPGVSTAIPYAALDAELAAIAANPACQLASLSVLAIQRGKIAYQQQFGQRLLASGALVARPANQHTLYRIASVSKLMTTLAALRLVEQGKLALDADISTYLGFTLRNPFHPGRPLTLRLLLTHTSSLRDDGGYSWPCSIALQRVLAPGGSHYGSGAMWARNAPPGEYFSYSNLGWGLIGTIMERVSGTRFDHLMQRLLLEPLGMRGGYNPSEFSPEDLANTATLYRKRTVDTEVWNSDGPWIAQVDDYSVRPPVRPAGIDSCAPGANATPFSPTGGLRASAAGLGQVMLMLMNDGVHQGRRILQTETLHTMFTRQWAHDVGSNGSGNGDTQRGLYHCWGLGNQQFPDRAGMRLAGQGGFPAVGHLGEAYGLTAVFAFDPVLHNGLIVLVGGVGSDPAAYQGANSAMSRYEEQIVSAVLRRVFCDSAGGNSERL